MGAIVEITLQPPLRPALPLPPEGRQAEDCLLTDGRIPEHPNRQARQQQAEAEIQIVGDGGLVESPCRLHRIAAQQLAVAAQLHHPSQGQAALLDHRVEGHFHRLAPGQPILITVDFRLAQLHRRPPACLGKGNQPLQQVWSHIGIGIQYQHPATLQSLQHLIEGGRFPPTGLPGAPQHLQLGMALLQLSQPCRRAVLTAVIDYPDPQQGLRPAQGREALDQAADHRLLIPGRHNHIDPGRGWLLAGLIRLLIRLQIRLGQGSIPRRQGGRRLGRFGSQSNRSQCIGGDQPCQQRQGQTPLALG